MADNPYKVVVEALAAQTAAIARLAHEIQTEFEQWKTAVDKRDNARAKAIADSINKRTAKLVEAADALEDSMPDAAPDQGLPEGPPSVDNTLPGQEPGVGGGPVRPGRPTDPDFGVDAPERPTAPDQPPGAPSRPDQGLPGERPPVVGGGPVRPDRPTDPDFGVPGDGGVSGRPDQGLPEGKPDRPTVPGTPDQGLPEAPPVVGGGPIDRPGTPGTPPERPQPKPVLDYIAPSTAKIGEDTFFDVHGDGFTVESKVAVDGEDVEITTYVNANLVRFHKTFANAGVSKVTVNNSDPLDVTVS